ncbi:hypothetical protein FRC10_003671 [Ceratobasidium sp. 414]|nr:hypothetical protein FRC10_003671 [Ceratobasidium sp. 414]
MNSTSAVRSQASANYNLYAPYNPNSSRLSSSAAQARLHRPISQNGYWQTPQPADTYAGTNVYDPYAVQDQAASSVGAITQYDSPAPVNSQLAPSPPRGVDHPETFDSAFSLSSTAGQPETSQNQHLGSSEYAPYYQAEHNATFSHHGQPHAPESSLDLPFTRASFSTPAAACAYAGPAQPSLCSRTYPTPQPSLLAEESTGIFRYDYSHRPDHTRTHSRPVSEGLMHPIPATISRPHSSYHGEHHAFLPHMLHSERRDSIGSSASPGDTFAYQIRDGQDGEYTRPTGYSQSQRTTCSPAATAASPSGHLAQPHSMSPPPHVSANSPSWGPSAPVERERSQPAPPTTASSAPDIGPPNAVQRRLGILMDAQRQHSEQDDRDNQPLKQTPRKSASSRRRKPNQSDESECESKPTSASKPKHKESVSRYKAAYERVRLQRNFFEGATASLLHQVRMLGGDPMQASDRASKGEGLDPQKARLLIASQQQDLETSRDKVIELQTELHRLRKIVEDNPRAYNPAEDKDRTPLSAAPTTVLGHLRK